MSVPPDRSLQQRRDALIRANDIRIPRAKLKKDIKAGRKNIVFIVENPPKEVETIKVVELLMSAPGLGKSKVNRLMTTCKMSPAKRLDGLSERQRDELLHHLRRRF